MWWLTVKYPPRTVQQLSLLLLHPRGDGEPHKANSWGCSKRSAVPLQEHQTALRCARHLPDSGTPLPFLQPPRRPLHWPKGTGMHHRMPDTVCSVLSPFSLTLLNTPLLMSTCSKPITCFSVVFFWSDLKSQEQWTDGSVLDYCSVLEPWRICSHIFGVSISVPQTGPANVYIDTCWGTPLHV